MLSVDEALALINQELWGSSRDTLPQVPIQDALHRFLAEEIVSDIDSPPHDKSLVDGYAVDAASISSAGVELTILEEVTAGQIPTKLVVPNTATRIMTGAAIPGGANAVVMVERTEPLGQTRVRLHEIPRHGQNIMRKGASLRKGEVVLSPPRPPLTAACIGLLAEVGRTTVAVLTPPGVAFLTTGNELVPTEVVPGPGQIRNSNGPMLEALIRQLGIVPVNLGIALDDREDLSNRIRLGLKSDYLVISGGVSAGVLDLIPSVLAELGVRQVFHKVSLKPGKPIWFGVFDKPEGRKALVFGLPGNPVSSYVCFELFVRHAIGDVFARHAHPEEIEPAMVVTARLTTDHQQRDDRPTYWPAQLTQDRDKWSVTLLPSKGSGDLKTLADANSLAFFPGEERLYKTGMEVTVRRL